MAEFTLNPQGKYDAQSGVSACTFCGSVDGPFVVVGQSEYVVSTPTGPVRTDKAIQFCAPRAENGVTIRQGCVGTIALLVGYIDPTDVEMLRAELHVRAEAVATLMAELGRAEREQVKVVPIDDVVALLRDAALSAKA